MTARSHHEAEIRQKAALESMRQGNKLAKDLWERQHPGSRLAPVIDKLRNSHGFTIRDDGTKAKPYWMPHPQQMPTMVEKTNEMQEAYYASEHWSTVRLDRMEYDDFRCVLCGDREPLRVHHIRYRLFAESRSDLLTVCEDCHDIIHANAKLAFPSGLTSTQVARLGLRCSFPDWTLPINNGFLF